MPISRALRPTVWARAVGSWTPSAGSWTPSDGSWTPPGWTDPIRPAPNRPLPGRARRSRSATTLDVTPCPPRGVRNRTAESCPVGSGGGGEICDGPRVAGRHKGGASSCDPPCSDARWGLVCQTRDARPQRWGQWWGGETPLRVRCGWGQLSGSVFGLFKIDNLRNTPRRRSSVVRRLHRIGGIRIAAWQPASERAAGCDVRLEAEAGSL